MNFCIKKCIVGFRAINPNTVKKVLLLAVAIIFSTYLIVEHGLSGLIVVCIPIGLSILMMCLRKMSFASILSFGDLFKKNIVDELPVDVNISSEKLEIVIHNAERMNGRTYNSIYRYTPQSISEVAYYEKAGLLKFCSSKVNASLVDAVTSKESKTYSVSKPLLGLYLDDTQGHIIINKLKECGYNVLIAEEEILKHREKLKKEKEAKLVQSNSVETDNIKN